MLEIDCPLKPFVLFFFFKTTQYLLELDSTWQLQNIKEKTAFLQLKHILISNIIKLFMMLKDKFCFYCQENPSQVGHPTLLLVF